MNELSDKDWELLSANQDGELSSEQKITLEKRLQTEPALAQAAQELRELSGAVKRLDLNNEFEPGGSGDVDNGRTWFEPRAMAACLGGLLLLAGIVWTYQFATGSRVDRLHSELSRIAVADQNTGFDLTLARLAGFDEVPDLAPAGLSLADIRTFNQSALAFHYAGRRGCRLTLIVAKQPDAIETHPSERYLSRTWQAASFTYQVLASGMDTQRFAAVSAYIEAVTGHRPLERTVTAMRETTQSSKTCA